MTIRQALEHLDSLHRNACADADKIQWLSHLDAAVKTEIFDCCEGEEHPFAGYDDRTDRDTALLAAAPFDQMYGYYLQAQIHYHNGELDRYNNAMALFQAVYDSFRRHYNRSHRPKGGALRYF